MVLKGCERVSPLVESVLLTNKTEADELVAVSERSLMTFPSRRNFEPHPPTRVSVQIAAELTEFSPMTDVEPGSIRG